jgi:uncharacterized protein (TIGR02270 family)
MPIISEIVEQHAEEAAFNWLLRGHAVSEPHYDLADLAHLDDRVDADIDGLRIAGDAGWEICREAMEFFKEPGEIFTAGVLAFESQVPERMDHLLGAVADDVELQGALCSALGWLEFHQVAAPAHQLLGADPDFLKRIALGVHAVHRQDIGPDLAAHIVHTDSLIRSRALKAAGELGRVDLLSMVLDRVTEKNEKCRFYAAWSAVLLGDSGGIDPLKRMAEAPSVYAQRACEMAVRKLDRGHAVYWLKALGRRSSSVRPAIYGLGALGDPRTVPWFIEMMQMPALARPAGEAFSTITGIDIAYEDLETDAPEDFQVGPTENPEDEDVELDPDEDLPWPDPQLIGAWWHDHQKMFQEGNRYLAGGPITSENCTHVLITGYQRQRLAAATELALLHPGRPLFEVRAPGRRQQRMLVVDHQAAGG